MIKFLAKLPSDKGFSLIELMVTVGIIGVLSSIAVPKFTALTARAKQSEAKNNMSHILTLQEAYRADNDEYWHGHGVWGRKLNPIGFDAGDTARYKYSTATYATDSVTIVAKAIDPDTIKPGCKEDHWGMDESGKITNYANCAVP